MITEIHEKDIAECVNVIKESFLTVADELGYTILPQYRHKHIGAKLLEDAYIRAKEVGCKIMNIGIVEENTILRKWYEDNGFIHIETKKFDFFPFTCGYMERDL